MKLLQKGKYAKKLKNINKLFLIEKNVGKYFKNSI
jgi:hypothetical protein